jgi:hypothetical protein
MAIAVKSKTKITIQNFDRFAALIIDSPFVAGPPFDQKQDLPAEQLARPLCRVMGFRVYLSAPDGSLQSLVRATHAQAQYPQYAVRAPILFDTHPAVMG